MADHRRLRAPLAGRPAAGVTLLELLITITLATALIALGVPSLERLGLDARRTAAVNAFVTAIQLARSESAKRGRPVVLCQTPDGFACAADGRDYAAGWMVFVNTDDRRPPARAPGEPLLLRHAPTIDGPVHSNRAMYEFRPFRRRSTNGTVTFCDRRGAGHARAVIISYTARPRTDSAGPGGRPLVCADLP